MIPSHEHLPVNLLAASFNNTAAAYNNLKKTAITIMAENYPKEPIMDEYLSIFPNADAYQLKEMDLRGRFLENIQPLLTIANNNGFEYMRNYMI